MTDLAYFLGCALRTQDRRAHYDALLRAYHDALGPRAPITLDDVREGVRRQSFFGVMMAIVSSMLVERTERGDRMFMTMLQRHCDHVLDTDALATLPDPRRRRSRCGRRRRTNKRTPQRRRTAVERELVCRLRRPGTGIRRLVPARPDSQPGRGVDPRAAVRAGPADRRRRRLSKSRCPQTRGRCAPTTSRSVTPPASRCRPIASTCGRGVRLTRTRRPCYAASRELRSR